MSHDGEGVAPERKTGLIWRGTKYTRGWARRYVTLEIASRRLMYSENERAATKGVMLLKKVTRSAEKNESLTVGNPDLYSFAVDGVDPEGKEICWLLRCDDESSFMSWYQEIRNAIAAHGLCDSVHYGLPRNGLDPRCDLPLANVPPQFLFRFSLLEKAIMYYFGLVSVVKTTSIPEPGVAPAPNSLMYGDYILVLCDKSLYLFNVSADVIRCAPISGLQSIYAGDKCIGLKLQHPQHDILFRTEQAVQIIDILRRTVSVATGSDIDVDLSEETPEGMLTTTDLRLRAYEGYALSVNAPTPKAKLKHALEVYERQTGQKFVYGSAQNPAQVQKQQQHKAEDMDIEDPMAALLMRLKLNQYIVVMQRQHLDLDVLQCMEEADLQSFGITDSEHRRMILDAARNGADSVVQAHAGGGGGGGGGGDDDDDLDIPKKPLAKDDSIALQARKPALVLDDSDDDIIIHMSNKKKVVLDDDDDIVLPKKSGLVLDDSDDDGSSRTLPRGGGGGGVAVVDDDI